MSDKIILTGIRVFGRHGCSFEEQTLGQYFIVDIEMSVDLSKACRSDSMDDTVDYAQVMFLVEKIVSGKPRSLIESVAEEIAAEILSRYDKVNRVKVVLHKPYAPLHINYFDAAVVVVRDRELTEIVETANEFEMFGVMTTSNFGITYKVRKNGVNAGLKEYFIDGKHKYNGKDVTKTLAKEVFLERYKAADSATDNAPLKLYLKRTLRGVNLTIEATCEKRSAKEYVVLKGSYISPVQAESIPAKTKQLRKTAKRTADNILLEDVTFSTASAAAEFVVGNMANGLKEWKTADGTPLGDL